jgi:hypothetical protein
MLSSRAERMERGCAANRRAGREAERVVFALLADVHLVVAAARTNAGPDTSARTRC